MDIRKLALAAASAAVMATTTIAAPASADGDQPVCVGCYGEVDTWSQGTNYGLIDTDGLPANAEGYGAFMSAREQTIDVSNLGGDGFRMLARDYMFNAAQVGATFELPAGGSAYMSLGVGGYGHMGFDATTCGDCAPTAPAPADTPSM